MKTSQKILVALAGFGLGIYLGWGIYGFWSKIHRFFFDRRWNNVKLPVFHRMSDIVQHMKKFSWKKDGMTEMFDAVCTPQKVQAVGFDKHASPHGNDCDEEAIWLTNVINKSLSYLAKNDGENFINAAFFLTVTWYELQGRTGGHNVCLLSSSKGWRYMDYGNPSEHKDTVDEIADLVISRYAGWDTTGHGTQKAVRLCWCISDKNLKSLVCRMF